MSELKPTKDLIDHFEEDLEWSRPSWVELVSILRSLDERVGQMEDHISDMWRKVVRAGTRYR